MGVDKLDSFNRVGEVENAVGVGDGGGVDAGFLSPADGVAVGGGGVGDEDERHLVVGYASGAVRVFDVPSATTLFESQQHRGAVQQVGSVDWLVCFSFA